MAKSKAKARFSLKDHLFNKERLEYLADLFSAADDRFEASIFVHETMLLLPKLELKQRIVHIASTLEKHLATDFRVAAKQISIALPPPLDPTKKDDDFGDFIFAPLGEFVVRNGLTKKHLNLSLATLREITQRFSMEDAIRRFINAHPQETLAVLKQWANDSNYHVRRLVSEGTRPSLPWSGRLSIDVETPISLLDQLHGDSTRYVTRSVANHLNDISKTHPPVVFSALKRWRRQGSQDPSELLWMSKHALRTLIKRGNADALTFLGFSSKPQIKITQFTLKSSRIRSGQSLEFAFSVTATRNETLMVDYVIDFVKANGKLSPRVHKLKQLSLSKGEKVVVSKRHVLKADATTYTLYPGTHRVTLQINGKSFGTRSFEVV
jgi:3-methyladenine DNA glycosylase AlkC